MKRFIAAIVVVVPSIALADAPKPADDLTELAHETAGTWKCSGKAFDGAAMVDTKGTVVNKVAVDGWTLESTLTAKTGPTTFKLTSMTTFDASQMKFFRHAVDNMGMADDATGAPINHGMAGKWSLDWDGQSTKLVAPAAPKDKPAPGSPEEARAQAINEARKAGILGNYQTRHHESMSRAEGYHLVGERRVGDSWVTTYDVTCKR